MDQGMFDEVIESHKDADPLPSRDDDPIFKEY